MGAAVAEQADRALRRKTRLRRGDNAQLARITFVDDLKEAPVAKAAAITETPKQPETKKSVPVKKPKTVTAKESKS